MKRILFLFVVLCGCLAASAQTMRVWQGGEYRAVTAAEAGEMTFGFFGRNITIGGTTYAVADIDSITMAPAVSTDGRVVVTWSGTTATVQVPSTVTGVTYRCTGANVSITSTNTTDEVEYVLRGSSTDGSLLFNGEYKCTFILDGLQLTSATTAPIDIECGKRINLQLADGTVSTLEDAAGGDQKAALYTKGHIEIGGAGTLNVTGRARHGIASKEYCQLKRTTGTVNILAAASDGIHAGQYFQMNGGNLTITANVGDAIQAEATTDPEDEKNGQMIIKGGTITASATSDDVKCLKADTDITISGGTLRLTASGAGSRGIQTDGSLLINEDDARTVIDITATGDQYDDGTGDKSRCWGIKVKGNLTRNAGTVKISASGKAKEYKADGTVTGM